MLLVTHLRDTWGKTKSNPAIRNECCHSKLGIFHCLIILLVKSICPFYGRYVIVFNLCTKFIQISQDELPNVNGQTVDQVCKALGFRI